MECRLNYKVERLSYSRIYPVVLSSHLLETGELDTADAAHGKVSVWLPFLVSITFLEPKIK